MSERDARDRSPRQAGLTGMLAGDDVTLQEAALILASSVGAVRRHIVAGRLSRRDVAEPLTISRVSVERLASEIYPWRRHLNDPEPYWVTGQRAADIIGVSRSRLGQLADAHRLPHIRHQDGTRLYPRLALIAAREARRARPAP